MSHRVPSAADGGWGSFFGSSARPALLEALEPRRMLVIPGTTLGAWDSYTTLTSELQTIHAAYPSLTELVSIGKTVQDRDIWALRITDNPADEEDEPEVLYLGSMHGDEPVGMEMTFYLAQYLLENYNQPTGDGPRVTNLVNHMDLWLVPNLNWDGYARPGGAWRGNANGIDLNRNFPEWVLTPGSPPSGFGNMLDGPVPSAAGRQAETVAMMNWRRSRHFVVSANLHGGALVVNYPWDTNNNGFADYAAPPDDALFRELALTYARQNGPMFAGNGGFPQGVTNGDEWYEITGGMQDWSVLYTGSLETTIELSNTKFPAASTLPTFWGQNRESMLQYMEAANWGVRGLITRSTDGAPVAAKVSVIHPAPAPTPDPTHPQRLAMFSDPDLGDFHRPLLPGTYSLRFEAPGYQPRTIDNVVVASRTTNPLATLRLDVALTPADTVAPVVAAAAFGFERAPNGITFSFSEDVGSSIAAGDLLLTNLTTGMTVPASGLAVTYAAETYTASFTAPGLEGGVFPDGRYAATIPADAVRDAWGNPLTGDAVLSFFAFSGDANRDGRADINDLSIVAANFNTPGTFSRGDFDYTGTITLADFSLLAARFNTALPVARGVVGPFRPGQQIGVPPVRAWQPTDGLLRADEQEADDDVVGMPV
jgi:hypothetical protein